MAIQHVYFISGLGANSDVFSRLDLHESCNIHYLEWLDPEEGEDFIAYCTRMASRIENSSEATLIGLSFGGVVAQTIASLIPLKRLIILSSVKTRKEMPLHLKSLKAIGIHQIVDYDLLLKMKPVAHMFFGTETPDDKAMLEDQLSKSRAGLVKWSVNQLINWKPRSPLIDPIHIHGTNDRVFPHENIKADFLVENGPHFMVYSHHREVSAILNDIIVS